MLLFDLRKWIYRLMILVIAVVAIATLLGPKPQLIKHEKPKEVPVQVQNEEKVDWLAKYKKADYQVYVSYDNKKPLKVDLIVALGGYTLICPKDLEKLLYDLSWQVKGNVIILTHLRRTIKMKLFEPVLISYVVKDKQLKYAMYKIPYPAVKLNGTYYVPLRTTLRAFGYGVRFMPSTEGKKKIIFGPDVPVDDSNLTFVRFLTADEVRKYEQ